MSDKYALDAKTRYEAATAEQKHYDRNSSLIIGAILSIPFISFTIYEKSNENAIFLFSALITALLTWWYFSSSKWARVARGTCANIEKEGFDQNNNVTVNEKKIKDEQKYFSVSCAYEGLVNVNGFENNNHETTKKDIPFRYKISIFSILLIIGYFIFLLKKSWVLAISTLAIIFLLDKFIMFIFEETIVALYDHFKRNKPNTYQAPGRQE